MTVNNLEKLKSLLAELLMLDQADLDFGIYRIMNAKRGEISKFLSDDLLPQVRQTLEESRNLERLQAQADIKKAEAAADAAGVASDKAPKVMELRERYVRLLDVATLEQEVFSCLYDFFRRYYSEGDFLALRRYKPGVYAVPYEGEEVYLHWANKDQYYIKSGEYFRDYCFKLADKRRVHFKLAAADTEKDNTKAEAGKERRFILVAGQPFAPNPKTKELEIVFEYRPDSEGRKQAALNAAAIAAIQTGLARHPEWLAELVGKWRRADGSESEQSVLQHRLDDYTTRNSFDYFIHKDLGGFLRRELDFYLKNEVMHLDDIEMEGIQKVEQALTKLKAIRRIAHKLIDFLAQLEEFQKKLWLKKKFVVATGWCVTLDRVPAELYAEIAGNKGQREEWVKLFAIDEIVGRTTAGNAGVPTGKKKTGKARIADTTPSLGIGTGENDTGSTRGEETGAPGYSVPLTVAFLKANPYLVLDTKFFPAVFTDKLLASIDNLDAQTDGLLIHSENFQALNLLQERYRKQINCIYIDPPYNTAASQIVYKNAYQHSSWLTLMQNRFALARELADNQTIICVAIDDFEQTVLDLLLEELFGRCLHLATVPIRSNPHGRAMAVGFSVNHEYAIFFSNTERAEIGRLARDAKRQSRYGERDDYGSFTWINFRKTGAASRREDRPKQYYPVWVSQDGLVHIPSLLWNDINERWSTQLSPGDSETAVWPLDDDGTERVWSLGAERASECATSELLARKVGKDWQVYRKYRPNENGSLPGTWWDDAKYSATESGTRILKQLFGERENFTYPKSVFLVQDCLLVSNANETALTIDYFAGSGTTGHAVINLNREDGGRRKYILVEMGDYFDTVLKPRIQKVVYAKEWKDGKPVTWNTGISHCFKSLRLESYEDTLNNLEPQRTLAQDELLAAHPAVREDYTLRYLLATETRESTSLLNLDRFRNPFAYTMKIATGSVGETRETTVDLVETFNYLIGLRVRHMDSIRGIRVITGTLPNGDKALLLWRNLNEVDNAVLDTFFVKQGYSTRDLEFAVIYVNGDNMLENLRRPDQTWKVRLIEQEFMRLMFAGTEAGG